MKVLNFGSLNQDYTYRVSHIVQEGETISSSSLEIYPGGKGLNQSVALSLAGAKTFHAGLIGNDGLWLREYCDRYGIDTSFIGLAEERTGNAIIQVDDKGNNSIILFSGANHAVSVELVEKTLENFSEGDLLLLQNEINASAYIIKKAKEKGMVIVVNPSPYTDEIAKWNVEQTDLLIMNEIEAFQMTGEQTPMIILDKLTARYPETSIVLTLGDKGAYFADKEKRVYQRALDIIPVDTTGAGDTFTGYFIKAFFLGHESPERSLEIATYAAAMATLREGAAVSIPAAAEVDGFMKKRGG